MAADLHDQPRLTLVSGVVRAACSADEVASTEEGYGIVVSEELRAFYMDVNGAEIVSMVGLADYLDLLLATRGRRGWHDGSQEVRASIAELFPNAPVP